MPTSTEQSALSPHARWWCDEGELRRLGATEDVLRESVLPGAGAEAGGVVLKQDQRSDVRRVEGGGRKWVVKRYRLPWWKQALYQAVRMSPAWREWRGARRLKAAGINVSMPVALVRRFRGRGEMLVLPYAEGEALGDVLRRDGRQLPRDPARRAWRLKLAAALGRQVGAITKAGLINRDHKPANIIVDERADYAPGEAEPVIIDPLGLRPRRGDQAVGRMIGHLYRVLRQSGEVSPREIVTFMRAMLAADATIAANAPKRQRRRSISRDIIPAPDPQPPPV